MKSFEYSRLCKELKAKTDIAKKQYQKLDNDYKFGKKIIIGKYNKSDLVYDTNHSFYKYYDDIKNFIVFLFYQSIYFT